MNMLSNAILIIDIVNYILQKKDKLTTLKKND